MKVALGYKTHIYFMFSEYIDTFFQKHCLFFWHDYQETTQEELDRLPSSEKFYWEVKECVKCKDRRMFMII